MARQKRAYFKVSFLLPEDCDIERAHGYIEESVRCWHGCLEPPHEDEDGGWTDGDPMFNLDPDTVKVTKIKPSSTNKRYSRLPRSSRSS